MTHGFLLSLDGLEPEPTPAKKKQPRVFLEMGTCGHVVAETGDRGREFGDVVICPVCDVQRRIVHITKSIKAAQDE